MAPAKKQAAKAVKKSPGTALVRWDEKFAKFAAAAVDKEKNLGGGTTIKFSPGSITYNGAAMPGGRFNVVVLESAFFNGYYEEAYDQDNPASPDCFALSLSDEDLAPHEKSAKPQSEDCASCPQNAWGSASTGRGKACGNKRRLALLAAKDCEEADGVSTAEMALAIVSPTNLKAWAGYVRSLAEQHGRPPWSVVTEIANVLDPGQTPSFHIEFSLVELIDDDDILTALEKRLPSAVDVLLRPFDPTPEAPAKPAKKTAVGKNNKFVAPSARAVAKPVPAKKGGR